MMCSILMQIKIIHRDTRNVEPEIMSPICHVTVRSRREKQKYKKLEQTYRGERKEQLDQVEANSQEQIEHNEQNVPETRRAENEAHVNQNKQSGCGDMNEPKTLSRKDRHIKREHNRNTQNKYASQSSDDNDDNETVNQHVSERSELNDPCEQSTSERINQFDRGDINRSNRQQIDNARKSGKPVQYDHNDQRSDRSGRHERRNKNEHRECKDRRDRSKSADRSVETDQNRTDRRERSESVKRSVDNNRNRNNRRDRSESVDRTIENDRNISDQRDRSESVDRSVHNDRRDRHEQRSRNDHSERSDHFDRSDGSENITRRDRSGCVRQSSKDSRDSDSESVSESIMQGRSRRQRKNVTYKEKPLNRYVCTLYNLG